MKENRSKLGRNCYNLCDLYNRFKQIARKEKWKKYQMCEKIVEYFGPDEIISIMNHALYNDIYSEDAGITSEKT